MPRNPTFSRRVFFDMNIKPNIDNLNTGDLCFFRVGKARCFFLDSFNFKLFEPTHILMVVSKTQVEGLSGTMLDKIEWLNLTLSTRGSFLIHPNVKSL